MSNRVWARSHELCATLAFRYSATRMAGSGM
jgi:hypothetical protein